MRKLAPAQVSHQYGFLMLCHFISRLFEGTLHVDKIHVRFKIANITHALPIPVHWQTNFTWKRVVN